MRFFLESKYKIIINIILLFIVLLILFNSHEFERKINNFSFETLKTILGEQTPDSNIVLITISENDISQIGPWPLKRSYYALLINKLTELGAKKIGFEILLSDKFVNLSVYDKLLDNEIIRSGKVVLSSVGFGGDSKNKNVVDSIIYSAPLYRNSNIKSGHLNFYENFGFDIPLVLISNDKNELSFSAALADLKIEDVKNEIKKVNFVSSWKKFKHYETVEFFEEVKNNLSFEKNIKDKIIIIGVTENTIAKEISSVYNVDSPGLVLHAFALDNILQNRFINDSIFNFSRVFFSILAFLFILGFNKKPYNYKIYGLILALIMLIVISLFLLNFNIIVSYSFYLIPLLVLLILEFGIYILEKRELLKGKISEAEVLKNLLSSKENELKNLEEESKLRGENESRQLLEKIKNLQNDIKRLTVKEEDNIKLEDENVEKKSSYFEGIVYRSKGMESVVSTIQKVAPVDATVLILGESGTGKELVAQALHKLSNRKSNNFVAVNCSALSENLLESELFGSVKGAYTGSVSDKIGRFEFADKGTFFLDEIAETSENFQAKLLRVIQNREFEKVGSNKTQKIDIRIIAATNKNLIDAVKEKSFREDLYYRLNVISIELTPLRERKEDIEPLTLYFIEKEEKDFSISKAAMDAIENHNWKGNVRELEGVIKRAVIFARSSERNMIQLQDLPNEIASASTMTFDEIVLDSLRNKEFSHSSIIETAKELEVSRTLISENFRGILFRTFVNLDFNIEKTVFEISGKDDKTVYEKIKSKLDKYLINIFTDIKKLSERDFESVKEKLNSKYKNLPQKFHFYLDEIIKYSLKEKV